MLSSASGSPPLEGVFTIRTIPMCAPPTALCSRRARHTGRRQFESNRLIALVAWSLLTLAQSSGRNALHAQKPRRTFEIVSARSLQLIPLDTVRPTSTLRLSDDSLEFGRVGSGCFFENGDAVALSTAPPRLIALHGGSVPAYRLIGKRGNGPGEFQQPWAVECVGRDSVSVLEPFRITEGELGGQLRSRAINASDRASWWDPIARVSDGTFLMRSRAKGGQGSSGTFRDTVDLVVGDPRRSGVMELRRLLRSPAGEYVRVYAGGGTTSAIHPFGRSLVVAAIDDVAYVMDTGTSDLIALPLDRRTARQVRFESVGRVVTRSARDLHESRRRAAARSPAERRLAEELLVRTVVPARAPLFDRIVATRGGGVWLREFVFEGDSVATWLQLDATMKPVRRWQLPATVRLLAATQTRALLVNAGEDGTEISVTELPTTRASRKDRS